MGGALLPVTPVSPSHPLSPTTRTSATGRMLLFWAFRLVVSFQLLHDNSPKSRLTLSARSDIKLVGPDTGGCDAAQRTGLYQRGNVFPVQVGVVDIGPAMYCGPALLVPAIIWVPRGLIPGMYSCSMPLGGFQTAWDYAVAGTVIGVSGALSQGTWA